jgi:hypothetical protein
MSARQADAQVPVYPEGASKEEIERAVDDDNRAWISFITFGLVHLPEKELEAGS